MTRTTLLLVTACAALAAVGAALLMADPLVPAGCRLLVPGQAAAVCCGGVWP